MVAKPCSNRAPHLDPTVSSTVADGGKQCTNGVLLSLHIRKPCTNRVLLGICTVAVAVAVAMAAVVVVVAVAVAVAMAAAVAAAVEKIWVRSPRPVLERIPLSSIPRRIQRPLCNACRYHR